MEWMSLTSKIQPVAGCASSKSCLKKKKSGKSNSFDFFLAHSTTPAPSFHWLQPGPLPGRTAGLFCSHASSQQYQLQHGAQLISPAELISSGFVECVASNEGVLHCIGSCELMHPSGVGSPRFQTLFCMWRRGWFVMRVFPLLFREFSLQLMLIYNNFLTAGKLSEYWRKVEFVSPLKKKGRVEQSAKVMVQSTCMDALCMLFSVRKGDATSTWHIWKGLKPS